MRNMVATKIPQMLSPVHCWGVVVWSTCIGAIQVLRNADGGGGIKFSGKKRYEGVKFNVIIITRG